MVLSYIRPIFLTELTKKPGRLNQSNSFRLDTGEEGIVISGLSVEVLNVENIGEPHVGSPEEPIGTLRAGFDLGERHTSRILPSK